jgi:hypothetical protein
VGFLAPRLAPREWSEGQSLARIAGTSVVRANSASVVGVVVSGVRGSAESKRPSRNAIGMWLPHDDTVFSGTEHTYAYTEVREEIINVASRSSNSSGTPDH